MGKSHQVIRIAMSGIAVAERLRAIRPDTVDALAQSMAEQGQLQPIVVRPRKDGGYWLVAGLHRLEAAKKLKWREINCTVFDHMEADEAELAEIDENLIRTNLTPAEEAMHLTRRKELYEKVHGKAKAKGARAANKKMGKKNDATDNLSDAFTTDVAKKTGQTARNVRRKVARSKKVAVLPRIVGTSLDKGRELDALAKLPASEQKSLAEAAKKGENVSAITARSACDPQDANMRLVIRDRAYLRQAVEALRLAHENKLAPIDPKEVIRAANAEITEAHVEAARVVARAWDFVAKQLERLRNDRGPDGARG